MRCTYRALKSSDIHIPGNLESQVHVQGCAHALERLEKALSAHLWLNLRLCASRKWKLRQSCKLPAECGRCAPTCMQRSISMACTLTSVKSSLTLISKIAWYSPTLPISHLYFIYIHITVTIKHANYFTYSHYLLSVPPPPPLPTHVQNIHEARIWFLPFLFTILTLINQNSPWHLVSVQTM